MASGASAAPAPAPTWQRFPRLQGRITAAQLGLVINSADPYSVAVGEYYAARRNIPEANILRLSLPLRAALDLAEFEALQAQIKAELGPEVQALALAWTQPYAVACNSITSALALGFQPEICKNSCAPSQPSPYFNYFGARPFRDLGLRPSMLLAARSVESAKALIERGIASDHSLPGFSPANAYFVSTSDTARNVRASLFPPASRLPGLQVQPVAQQHLPSMSRTLIYQTGLVSVPGLDQVDWLPGALADHLTSYGGQLERRLENGNVQMSALDWLEAGATASYGTVSEPCNHRQKFPHPQFLLLAYVQGVSALEAYWHSVLWPGQGLFIGEPLAAPFSRPF
ncbi:TIGR03790 family protein [Paucibacter sp. KBW04]|uniref:TIGR03790 family protein n=1 Tax=Paucibacter sp. KBW04 TaxID=2153361 RepID=UPI000F567A6A|nr:TIGR03790 family protein [Paucibacter sp. KBW04]RQO56502.1 TIGR03790 family protein [Paucibacter sp. KBW04]